MSSDRIKKLKENIVKIENDMNTKPEWVVDKYSYHSGYYLRKALENEVKNTTIRMSVFSSKKLLELLDNVKTVSEFIIEIRELLNNEYLLFSSVITERYHSLRLYGYIRLDTRYLEGNNRELSKEDLLNLLNDYEKGVVGIPINNGDFNTMKCEVCGRKIDRYFLWNDGTISVSAKRKKELKCISKTENIVEFKTGEVFVSDWFNMLNKFNDISNRFNINYICGNLQTTDFFAKKNIVHVGVGNSSPEIYTREETGLGTIYIGEIPEVDDLEEYNVETYHNYYKDVKKIGYVCTDLWAVTMLDRATYEELSGGIKPEDDGRLLEGFKKISIPKGKYKIIRPDHYWTSSDSAKDDFFFKLVKIDDTTTGDDEKMKMIEINLFSNKYSQIKQVLDKEVFRKELTITNNKDGHFSIIIPSYCNWVRLIGTMKKVDNSLLYEIINVVDGNYYTNDINEEVFTDSELIISIADEHTVTSLNPLTGISQQSEVFTTILTNDDMENIAAFNSSLGAKYITVIRKEIIEY